MLSTEHITSMPVVVMGIKNHAQNDVFAQNYSFGVVLTPNSPMCKYKYGTTQITVYSCPAQRPGRHRQRAAQAAGAQAPGRSAQAAARRRLIGDRDTYRQKIDVTLDDSCLGIHTEYADAESRAHENALLSRRTAATTRPRQSARLHSPVHRLPRAASHLIKP